MAASDHVSPHQLSMFMPARELYGMHALDTSGFGGDVAAMRSAKRDTNAKGKIGRSIEAEGVRKPVQVHHGNDPEINRFRGGVKGPALANGNHRVIAAYDANPDMEVPVEHYDSGNKLFVAMRREDTSDW